MCRLTKIIYYIPCNKNLLIKNLIHLIIRELIKLYKFPEYFNNNRELLFNFYFWQTLIINFEIKYKLTTIFYQQTNRQIKKNN